MRSSPSTTPGPTRELWGLPVSTGSGCVTMRARSSRVGVREPGISGYPVLAGITVHPSYRGSGLGLAVTAYLTRAAIAERGVSVLGMYSDNDRARRVYHGLGYGGDHLWSSAPLCRAPSGRRHGASRAPA